MSGNSISTLPNDRRAWYCQAAAWLIGAVTCLLAVLAWGNDFDWRFVPVNIYMLFSIMGLLAYSLMWSHYVAGSLRDILGLDKTVLVSYYKLTGWAVLVLICLHPGLLIYQRFRDGFGLPPGSYESYVAPGLGWLTLLGTVSLFVFVAYELYRVYGERGWWHYVQEAGDLAMVAIFYHGLRLGTQTSHGWFHLVWWFYGIVLIAILIRAYALKYMNHGSAAT